jgi:hypothetical protein
MEQKLKNEVIINVETNQINEVILRKSMNVIKEKNSLFQDLKGH